MPVIQIRNGRDTLYIFALMNTGFTWVYRHAVTGSRCLVNVHADGGITICKSMTNGIVET